MANDGLKIKVTIPPEVLKACEWIVQNADQIKLDASEGNHKAQHLMSTINDAGTSHKGIFSRLVEAVEDYGKDWTCSECGARGHRHLCK